MQKGDDFTRLVAYVEERTVLEERLQKMDAFRGSIKELIFRRVQRDYSTRLTTIREQFRPTMLEIVKRLKQLELEKDKIREKMDESNDLLTELRFRNEIGEYEESDFREQEDGLLLGLEDLTGSFEEIRRTIGDFMFYLHDDKDFRQMAAAEKLLERLEEDYKAERARAAEAEQSLRLARKLAAPAPAAPPRLTAGSASAGTAEPVADDEVVEGQVVEEESAGFLAQAFAQYGGAQESPRSAALASTATPAPAFPPPPPPPARETTGAAQRPASMPAGGPAAAKQGPPPPRRLPDSRPDPRLAKSKVIRRAPNSGT